MIPNTVYFGGYGAGRPPSGGGTSGGVMAGAGGTQYETGSPYPANSGGGTVVIEGATYGVSPTQCVYYTYPMSGGQHQLQQQQVQGGQQQLEGVPMFTGPPTVASGGGVPPHGGYMPLCRPLLHTVSQARPASSSPNTSSGTASAHPPGVLQYLPASALKHFPPGAPSSGGMESGQGEGQQFGVKHHLPAGPLISYPPHHVLTPMTAPGIRGVRPVGMVGLGMGAPQGVTYRTAGPKVGQQGWRSHFI